jgi:hypothetical protein
MTGPSHPPREPTEHGVSAEYSYLDFLTRLRGADPVFAEASVLASHRAGSWQAAVYQLAGCDVVWNKFGCAVMEQRTIAPVFEEIEHPTCAWGSGEHLVLIWAAHFWDRNQVARVPYNFDNQNYSRWLVALHLRRGIAPGPLLGA